MIDLTAGRFLIVERDEEANREELYYEIVEVDGRTVLKNEDSGEELTIPEFVGLKRTAKQTYSSRTKEYKDSRKEERTKRQER